MSLDTKETSVAPEITTNEPELTPPSDKADYIDLGYYIKQHLQAGERIEGVIKGIERRATVHRFYAGQALQVVRDKEAKDRRWVVWCRNHGFNVGTCYEAIRLYQRAVSVENVKNLTIAEARKKYQTNKKSFIPEGAKPQPKKVAQKVTVARTYPDNPTLKTMEERIISVFDVIAEVTPEDWANSDTEKYIQQFDDLMAKLRTARKAAREAQRADMKAAKEKVTNKPELQKKTTKKAAQPTSKEAPAEEPAKVTGSRRKA